MIDAGLIGTSYIGGIHISILNQICGIDVAAVYDISQEPARQTAVQFNISKIVLSDEGIINDPSLGVVHNCTPNKFHFPITKTTSEVGQSVINPT